MIFALTADEESPRNSDDSRNLMLFAPYEPSIGERDATYARPPIPKPKRGCRGISDA